MSVRRNVDSALDEKGPCRVWGQAGTVGLRPDSAGCSGLERGTHTWGRGTERWWEGRCDLQKASLGFAQRLGVESEREAEPRGLGTVCLQPAGGGFIKVGGIFPPPGGEREVVTSDICGDKAGREPKATGGRGRSGPATVTLELVSPGVPTSQRSQFSREISRMFNVGSIA